MFGSGYNPYRAAGIAESDRKNAAEAWGKKIYPCPASFKELLGEGGDFNIGLYEKLMLKSGAEQILNEKRAAAAQKLAEMPMVETEVSYVYSDSYRRESICTKEINVIEHNDSAEFLKLAEIIVLKEAQHTNLENFWSELYREMKKLGVKISMY